jgi:hypothetical protein
MSIAEDALNFVNIECGKTDDVDRLETLQNRLDYEFRAILGPGFLSKNSRNLLLEVPCTRLGMLGSDTKIVVLLFNDLILLSKEEGQGHHKTYKLYAKPIFLRLAVLADDAEDKDSEDRRSNSFRVSKTGRSSSMSRFSANLSKKGSSFQTDLGQRTTFFFFSSFLFLSNIPFLSNSRIKGTIGAKEREECDLDHRLGK